MTTTDLIKMTDAELRNASFKDFVDMPGMDAFKWAAYFDAYIKNWLARDHWHYRQENTSGCLPEVELNLPGNPNKSFVALVHNDYLGFTQHPLVKAAAIAAIEQYGVGTAASPAIGGQMSYHRQLEEKIAAFFKRDSALLFTTGYTANTATMQALLKKQDLAILDMSVHASMYEGVQHTNVKTFVHNNMERLERLLRENQGKYRSMWVIIDGVYSQPGDLAPLGEIVKLCKHYGAYLVMDDAHGVGVIGDTGRGVIELHEAWKDVDVITGTFSKTLGHLGGYVVADEQLVNYLKFQAGQHIFSVAATPASACILKSIDLIDDEPWWRSRLWENINYLKKGLQDLGLDTGTSASAIVPVMTGNPSLNAEVCKWLLEAGVYANQIGYPAVPKNKARIRMSVMATHSIDHMDTVLNAWEWVKTKMNIKNFE